jgi:hypothetical protein
MRLAAFTRTGRALAPLIGALVVLATIYGGGAAQAGEAYGFSAAVMFPVIAWQTKILLDVAPDVQRRLAIVAAGSSSRDWAAGLLAAGVAGLVVTALAIVVPWLLGGVTGPQDAGDPSLAVGFTVGIWAHVLLMLPALALGALASRAVTRGAATGITVLVGGAVVTFVVGVKTSPVPWLAAPVLEVGRVTAQGLSRAIPGYTVHALLWTVVALAGYAWLRPTRA